MKIKTLKMASGIPAARATVAYGESDDKIGQVNITMSAIDSFDVPFVVTSLRLTLDEARDLSRRILASTVTDEHIRSLREHASKPGGLIRDEGEDDLIVKRCDEALAGDVEARAALADLNEWNT